MNITEKRLYESEKNTEGTHIPQPPKNTTESTIGGKNGIFVVGFDKGYYRKNELDTKTDKELYEMAIEDKKHCVVRSADEFCDFFNGGHFHKEYVWDYIINIY